MMGQKHAGSAGTIFPLRLRRLPEQFCCFSVENIVLDYNLSFHFAQKSTVFRIEDMTDVFQNSFDRGSFACMPWFSRYDMI